MLDAFDKDLCMFSSLNPLLGYSLFSEILIKLIIKYFLRFKKIKGFNSYFFAFDFTAQIAFELTYLANFI